MTNTKQSKYTGRELSADERMQIAKEIVRSMQIDTVYRRISNYKNTDFIGTRNASREIPTRPIQIAS